jgi:hypothetical protein
MKPDSSSQFRFQLPILQYYSQIRLRHGTDTLRNRLPYESQENTKFIENLETGFRFPVQVPTAQPPVAFANPDMVRIQEFFFKLISWFHTDPAQKNFLDPRYTRTVPRYIILNRNKRSTMDPDRDPRPGCILKRM